MRPLRSEKWNSIQVWRIPWNQRGIDEFSKNTGKMINSPFLIVKTSNNHRKNAQQFPRKPNTLIKNH